MKKNKGPKYRHHPPKPRLRDQDEPVIEADPFRAPEHLETDRAEILRLAEVHRRRGYCCTDLTAAGTYRCDVCDVAKRIQPIQT